MVLNFANNKRQALARSVKFTLLSSVVALLFLGILATAADHVGNPTAPISRGEKSKTTESRQTPLIPPIDPKFLASLRFWEKDKQQPQPKPPATPRSAPVRPREIAPAKDTVSSTGHSASQAPQPRTATGIAPAPSPNPYSEREKTGFGDAPLPAGQFANHPHEPGGPSPQEAKPTTHYSFDTRDWVESFPFQQEQDPAQEDMAVSTQPTSLYLPSNQGIAEGDQWNGQATVLVSHVQHAPVPTVGTTMRSSLSPFSPNSITRSKTAPVEKSQEVASAVVQIEKPLLDLSPSYEKRLPHVQICGVVVVQADFPLTEIAAILGEIEQLQHDLNEYIGVPAPKEKIELCLFRSEETYINFLREFFPRAPRDRRALYIKLDKKPGTLLVQKSKDFELDLRHEMTHAIIHASIPKVPIWLDEGLAKYFEVPSKDRANNHPYMRDVRWQTKLGTVPSLDKLVKLETIDDMGAKEYRDSWAWTHFLIRRSPETHRLLAAYLQMLATWDGTEKDYAGTGGAVSFGERFFELSFSKGRDKKVPIPSLKLYLDDIMGNQREMFREHFGAYEK
jgi:hypothetical protein